MTNPAHLHAPEPVPNDGPDPHPETPRPTVPPIEEERGPQNPVREPGSPTPERVV